MTSNNGPWPLVPFGELTLNHDGMRVPVKGADRKAGPYPYYGASGIVDWVDSYLFDGEYLLIAEDGENLRTRKTPVAFIARGKFWVNNHAHIVQGNSKANTRYLMYALSQADIAAYLTGSTMPKLTQGNLNRIPIPAPSKPEQEAIAGVLGSLDDKIELNERMSETLEAMVQTLFRSWFVDFDPVWAKAEGRSPDGINAATSALFPDMFEESAQGPIPKRWRVDALGSTCQMLFGFAFPSSGFATSPPGVRLIRGDNVKEGVIEWGDKTRYWSSVTPELVRYELLAGDVLIGMDGSKVGRNWSRLGLADVPALLVQRVARLRASSPVGPGFIACHVASQQFKDYIDGVKTGTSIPHVSGGQIAAYPVVLPPASEPAVLNLFEKIVAPMLTKIDQLRSESTTLATLRDTWLPKLLSGELQVAHRKHLEVAQ